MTKNLCQTCENYDICIIRRNSEMTIYRCCMFCKNCKSYNWSCTNGPNVFNCDLGERFSALEKHACGKFKHD